MARGWESKSVEMQQESLTSAGEKIRVRNSTSEVELIRKRDGLVLSRTRVLADLKSSENPRVRKNLEDALAFLEQQITSVNAAIQTVAK